MLTHSFIQFVLHKVILGLPSANLVSHREELKKIKLQNCH